MFRSAGCGGRFRGRHARQSPRRFSGTVRRHNLATLVEPLCDWPSRRAKPAGAETAFWGRCHRREPPSKNPAGFPAAPIGPVYCGPTSGGIRVLGIRDRRPIIWLMNWGENAAKGENNSPIAERPDPSNRSRSRAPPASSSKKQKWRNQGGFHSRSFVTPTSRV